MAYGNRAFRRVQIGKESTRGTAVAATSIHYPDADGFTMEEPRSFHEPEEERNSLALNHRSTLSGIGPVAMQFNGDALFEQLQYWLAGGVKGGVSPTTPAGAVRLWTYSPSFSATNAQQTYTIEYGDDVQAWEVEFAFVKSITLSGSPGQPVKVSVALEGRQQSDTTFTAALTDISVENLVSNKAKLFIDTAWAGVGTTEVAATLIDFSLTINSGLVATKRLDGTNLFTKIAENRRKLVEAAFTFEFNDTTKAYRSLFQNDTLRVFSLEILGSNIETTYDKFFKARFSGKYRSWGNLGNQDGIDTVAVNVVSQYDTTGAKEAEFLLQNTIGSLV